MSRLLTLGILQQARNLVQSGGGSLIAVAVDSTTATDPCNTLTTPATIYCQYSGLSHAFTNNTPIWADSSGNFYAATAWYSDSPNQWFFWDANKASWGDDILCGGAQLTLFSIMGPFRDACRESDNYFDVWFDDVGNFGIPITGAFIYTDLNGNNPLDPGYYAWEDLGNQERTWLEVGNNGEVVLHGKC